MQQAARVSDRTAFFYLGKLIEEGDTRTIFTKPRNRQTEDYITAASAKKGQSCSNAIISPRSSPNFGCGSSAWLP